MPTLHVGYGHIDPRELDFRLKRLLEYHFRFMLRTSGDIVDQIQGPPH